MTDSLSFGNFSVRSVLKRLSGSYKSCFCLFLCSSFQCNPLYIFCMSSGIYVDLSTF